MNARAGWRFVPTLYFQQGLPVVLVQQLSVLIFKSLGVGNERVAVWTSLLSWPWILKMLWAPLVDRRSTKRAWVLGSQAAVVAALFALAWGVLAADFFAVSLVCLGALALFSATHDIALDGFYLGALGSREQAYFAGVRSAAFRLAMVFCTGGLTMLAGVFERGGADAPASWSRALLAGAALYGALALYAGGAMPRLPADRGADRPESGFGAAFRSFLSQPRAGAIVAFILVYRVGECMVSKMSGIFLLDSRGAGGLGFDTLQTGVVLGTVGVAALVGGGILGGMAVARFGLRRCLWPMALVMHLPNLLYIWAAATQPGPARAAFVVGVDQFAYGFGLASYLVYLMRVCRHPRFQASHYAIATGLMALGAMGAGVLAGVLQPRLGYTGFFVAVCVLTLPGLWLLGRIPLDTEEASPSAVEGAHAT
jgi:PAT family beta-lactamase induction signal transducer AmpG